MKKIALGLVIVLFSSFAGAAEYGLALQVESQIGTRIRTLIHSVDPSAQVLVRVKLKTSRGALPGTGADYEGVLGATDLVDLTQDDLEKVDIRIISKVDPFPDGVLKSVREDLGVDEKRMTIKLEKMDVQTAEVVSKGADIRDLANRVDASIGKGTNSFRIGFLLFFLLGAGLVAVHGVNGARTRKMVTSAVQEIREQFAQFSENGGGGGRREIDVGQAQISTASQRQISAGADSQRDSLTGLATEALVSLFTDAYWTENDAYAAWLWRQLPPTHRGAVIEMWKGATEYVRYLASVDPIPAEFHLHPCYLRPIQIHHLSQSDLAHWVGQLPGVWNLVSPMRQATLPVSIIKKLEWANLTVSTFEVKIPTKASPGRVLSGSSEFGELTLEDEEKIFENPEIVPMTLRKKVPSLVWLAIQDSEMRATTLQSYSAAELAQAWIGSKSILAKLEEALPEKKKKLLESYRQSVRPSRQSSVFSALMNLGIGGLQSDSDGAETRSEAA